MSMPTSICSTCLSSLGDGDSAKLTETFSTFLCDILHFKAQILAETHQNICRKCYKTLIELKCFYNQLRDVEVYFENKSGVINKCTDSAIEEENDDMPYVENLECTVSIADESKLDPIVIDEDEDCCVIEDELPEKKPKLCDTPTGKRIVCLTCSKLFQSVSDLRSHEKTAHSVPIAIQKASPVFVQIPKISNCSEYKVGTETLGKPSQIPELIRQSCDACKQVLTTIQLPGNKQLCNNCDPNVKNKNVQILNENEKQNGSTNKARVFILKGFENNKDSPSPNI